MVPRSVPRNTPSNAPCNRFLEPFAKFTVTSSQVSTCFGGCYWAPYQAPVSGRPQHCFVAVGRAAARLGVDGQVARRVGGAGVLWCGGPAGRCVGGRVGACSAGRVLGRVAMRRSDLWRAAAMGAWPGLWLGA